jgi:hypothetical protein
MGDRNSPDELLIHIEYIRKGIDGIHERLDAQNGRIRTAETKIAVLEALDAKASGGKWGAIAGGVITGLIYAINAIFGGAK